MSLNEPISLLRLPQVLDRVGLGKSSVYAMIQRQEFPTPIRICGRISAWDSSAIDTWVEEQISKSGGTP